MNTVTFEIHLREPLLATQPESGEENSATSYSFVPGSMLRGALIAAYKRKYKPKDFLKNLIAQRLFLNGAVRYLNAYPLHVAASRRMLPTPASWRVDKDAVGENQADVHDFAFGLPNESDDLKAPPWEYCLITPTHAERYNPERYLQVHNASSKRSYKDAQVSQVFRYEALAAGEILVGAILVDDGDFTLVQELLKENLRIGGSHTAGYGHVEITNIETHTDWQEAPSVEPNAIDSDDDAEQSEPGSDAPSEIIVTLLSDAILRDANFDAALQNALELETLKHTRAFASVRVVGGFNRTAGLPLPQEWALRAGSVFVYDANAFDVETARTLQSRGLGERTIDGFGRFAVNWQRQSTCTAHKLEPLDNRAPLTITLSPETKLPPLSEASERLAIEMANRQLRAKLERVLIEKINATAWQTDPPKNSQLGRVRTAARNALYAGTLKPITDLMDGLKGARKQFERARIGTDMAWDWLTARVSWNLETFRTEFGVDEASVPRVGMRPPTVDEALRVEFMARWIDGVMQRGQKRNRDKEVR